DAPEAGGELPRHGEVDVAVGGCVTMLDARGSWRFHDRSHRGGPVVDAPGDDRRRERVIGTAVVGIRRGGAEQGELAHVPQETRQVAPTGAAELATIMHDVVLAPPQALVYVHAAAGLVGPWLGEECRIQPVCPGKFPYEMPYQ